MALALLIGSGCKKDSNDTCDLSSSAIVGNYKITAATLQSGTSTPEVNVLNTFFEPCQLDDITTLNANNTFAYQDQGTVCDPSGSYTGTWSLSGNNLTVIADGDTSTATVSSFDCNNFVVSSIELGSTFRVTYTRQ